MCFYDVFTRIKNTNKIHSPEIGGPRRIGPHSMMVTSPTALENLRAPTRSFSTSNIRLHTMPNATPKNTAYTTRPAYPVDRGHRRWHTPLDATAKLNKYWILGLIHLVLAIRPVPGLANMSARAKMESSKAAGY